MASSEYQDGIIETEERYSQLILSFVEHLIENISIFYLTLELGVG